MNSPLPHCPTDRIVCRCLKVTESTILEAIEHGACETVREVRDETGAGSGCTCCHRRILAMIAQHRVTHTAVSK